MISRYLINDRASSRSSEGSDPRPHGQQWSCCSRKLSAHPICSNAKNNCACIQLAAGVTELPCTMLVLYKEKCPFWVRAGLLLQVVPVSLGEAGSKKSP